MWLFADSDTGSLATVSVLAYGFVLGLKHAVEADHLAAVSTIVSERKSLLSSSLVGGLWGLGHTISLLIAGVAVILLNFHISPRIETALEFCVGLMLIALGFNALRKLKRGGHLHFHVHKHGGKLHTHPHLHEASNQLETQQPHHHALNPRPLFIGMMHGLAGSAALMLMVIPTIHAPAIALVYVAIFGVGSIGGMMLMSVLVGLPVLFTASRFARVNLLLRGLAGVFSLGLGLFWASTSLARLAG